MTVFLAVVDSGGFAAASRQLNLSAPTITRAIAAIELRVGAELFVRTTRFVRLTDAGARYLGHCRRIVRDLEESEARAAGAHLAPQGTLVIAAPILFGQRLLLPLLVEFLRAFPAVSARALLVDRTIQLDEEGVDAAFRMGPLPDSALVATTLGHVRRVLVASPAYLAQLGRPQRPSELTTHAIVASAADGRSDRWIFEDGAQQVDVDIAPRLIVSTNEAAILAAEAGVGLTRVMSYQIEESLRAGRLERVLQQHESAPLPVSLVTLEGRHGAAKLRSFVSFVAERLRGHPALLG